MVNGSPENSCQRAQGKLEGQMPEPGLLPSQLSHLTDNLAGLGHSIRSSVFPEDKPLSPSMVYSG